MALDWWTFGLEALNFLVLVALLRHFLFRPVAGIIAERQAKVRAMLAEAEAARRAAEAERERLAVEIARQAAERAHILEAAEKEAAKRREELLAEARREAERIIAEARAEARRIASEEASALEARAAELAVEIAARLLARLPDEARVSPFIPGLVEAVEKLPEETRAHLAPDGAPLVLRVPRALSEAEERAVRDALARAVAEGAAISIEPDPAIVAGLELAGPFGVVRNSFRADLDAVREVLAGDERG